jgi:cation:H+ antiporter
VLFAALIAFIVIAHRWQQLPGEQIPEEVLEYERVRILVVPRPGGSVASEGALTLLGIVVLAAGARAFVDGAAGMARELGMAEFAIGATLVAAGTSLPEVATSAVAAYRRLGELAVANVLGSNIFNTLGVVGAAAMLGPLPIDPELMRFEVPVMVLATVVLVPMMWTQFRLSRREGVLLLAGYIAVTVAMLMRG